MTHQQKIRRWISPEKIGVEIGAFKYPVPGITPFYVDCFTEFGNEKVFADYYGHAGFLPFKDNSLDYVVASHVLEHVANPVAALAEWYRVLRPGGIIYLLVPDRRFTWDHGRPLTTVDHMLEDFARETTASDPTHIDDFVYGMEWSLFDPATPLDHVSARRDEMAAGMRHAVSQGQDINIHFHVFEPENVLGMIERLRRNDAPRFNWELVDQAERFPETNANGFLAVIRVKKTVRDRVAGWWNYLITRSVKEHPLRHDAQPFTEFQKTARGIGGVR